MTIRNICIFSLCCFYFCMCFYPGRSEDLTWKCEALTWNPHINLCVQDCLWSTMEHTFLVLDNVWYTFRFFLKFTKDFGDTSSHLKIIVLSKMQSANKLSLKLKLKLLHFWKWPSSPIIIVNINHYFCSSYALLLDLKYFS